MEHPILLIGFVIFVLAVVVAIWQAKRKANRRHEEELRKKRIAALDEMRLRNTTRPTDKAAEIFGARKRPTTKHPDLAAPYQSKVSPTRQPEDDALLATAAILAFQDRKIDDAVAEGLRSGGGGNFDGGGAGVTDWSKLDPAPEPPSRSMDYGNFVTPPAPDPTPAPAPEPDYSCRASDPVPDYEPAPAPSYSAPEPAPAPSYSAPEPAPAPAPEPAPAPAPAPD